MSSELADDFRALREHNREQAEKRRDRNVKSIDDLRWITDPEWPDQYRFWVRELTPYQFRIDDVLDIFPTNTKFHNIKTGERGWYRPSELLEMVERELAKAEAK